MAQDLLETDTSVSTTFRQVQEEDNIDFGEIFATILDNKWFIVVITTLVLVFGVAFAFLTTPIYLADALLQIDDKKQGLSLGELGGDLSELMGEKSQAPKQIEILGSRKVLDTVIKKQKLEIIAEPKYFPIIGKFIARMYKDLDYKGVADPILNLESIAWGGETIKVDTFTVPAKLEGKKFILIAGEHGRFKLVYDDEIILEGEVGQLVTDHHEGYEQSFSISISFLKSRPNTEFRLIKKTYDETIEEFRKDLKFEEKGKKTDLLALTYLSNDPYKAMQTINEIVSVFVKQNRETKTAEAQKTLEFLDKQLPILKDQLDAATKALNDYRTRKGSIDLEIETQSLLEAIVGLQTDWNILKAQRDELRQKFTESHPNIVGLDKKIARIEEQIQSAEKKISTLPDTQQVILRLMRDVEVSNELYVTVLQNSQKVRVAKEGAVGEIIIIDEAILPNIPDRPKKALIVTISFVLGLVLSIAIVLIKKAHQMGIEDPEEIEKHLNIPVYATVPHSAVQDKINVQIKKNSKANQNELLVLALKDKDDLAIESLRSLRTTLHFAFLESQNNIIMITGASPGIGKTFVSTNLAVLLADSGKKILLIDGDLRKGFLNKILGVERKQGLSNLIVNPSLLDQSIQIIPEANIDFLSTGAIPPNPAELLLHERFGKLLETLSTRYDHIIIDSPPILAVTDASIIGRMAGATLMVVKAGAHPMRELEQSIKRFSQAGVHIKGIVFNDMQEISSSYGYGRYVYQYNYSSTTKA